MKVLIILSLLLLFTTIHSTSYKDNQTNIYATPYSGEIIKTGDISYQASRIVIGVKEGVTKDEVTELAKSFGGEISGWVLSNDEQADSYVIDLPTDKREPALFAFKNNPKVLYAIRNQVFDESNFNYTEYPEYILSNNYNGEIIPDKTGTYFDASKILLTVSSNTTKSQIKELISPYGAVITGWIRDKDKEPDSYDIQLPTDQRELAIRDLSTKPEIEGAAINIYLFKNTESTSNYETPPLNGGFENDSLNLFKQLVGIGIILLVIVLIVYFVFQKFKNK